MDNTQPNQLFAGIHVKQGQQGTLGVAEEPEELH